jgi:hypothetical protein
MDTLIVIVVSLYILFESYAALEAMPKVSVLRFFHELRNPYAMKYWGSGLYALAVLYHAADLQGWLALIVVPPLFCVSGRFAYRVRHAKWHQTN